MKIIKSSFLTLGQISKALEHMNVYRVHKETGIAQSSLTHLKKGGYEGGYHHKTIVAISEFLIEESRVMVEILKPPEF